MNTTPNTARSFYSESITLGRTLATFPIVNNCGGGDFVYAAVEIDGEYTERGDRFTALVIRIDADDEQAVALEAFGNAGAAVLAAMDRAGYPREEVVR